MDFSQFYEVGQKDYFKRAFGIDTENPKIFWLNLLMESRCSAYFKLIGDNLYSGHTTWGSYSEAARIFKTYKFEGRTVKFSSYPGVIHSVDDFYVTGEKLVILSTSIGIVDVNLYKNIKSSKAFIPSFFKVTVATRRAKSAVYC